MKVNECIPYFDYMITLLKQDIKEQFRLKNYEKWRKLLAGLDPNMTLVLDNLDFPSKMITKLQEIITSGTINNMTLPQSSSTQDAPQLCDFYGFGPATSKKYEQDGITGADLLFEWESFIRDNNAELMLCKRPMPEWINESEWNSMSDDRQNAARLEELNKELKRDTKYLGLLNYHQLVGVKHYYNMMQKIPRAELVKLEKVIKTIITRMNSKFVVEICGSYRRGCLQSGDIDCLITHPDLKTQDNPELLCNIVKMLIKCNVIIDNLTEGGGTKYMGFCQIKKSIPRRIDIRIIAWASFAYATLYFTGSKNHNKEMRGIAKQKGYKLNEYGMQNITTHEFIECNTETEIFAFLDMPYVAPTDRNIP